MPNDESLGAWARYYTERYDNVNSLEKLLKRLLEQLTEGFLNRLDVISRQLSEIQAPNSGSSVDLNPILAAIAANQEQIMAKFEDVKKQAADNKALAEKNQAELVSTLADLKTQTEKASDLQGKIDAAVADAKAAQKAEDQVAFDAAMAEIERLQTEQSEVLKATDEKVADAVAAPTPTTEPTPVPETPTPAPVETAPTPAPESPVNPGSTPTPESPVEVVG